MAWPAGFKVAIEFGTLYSGVWTDVTADVDSSSQGQIHFGRTDPRASASTGTMNLRLSNALGKYTPQRQVLADGVTAHPYYPNVLPDKRIQISWTISAVTYPRFTGFINSWVPGLENGVRAFVDITASDIMDRLSRVSLQSTMLQEILADSPLRLWTMNDGTGSTTALDQSGNGGAPLVVSGTAPTFGGVGPGAGDGTGALFVPGELMVAPIAPQAGPYTWEIFLNLGAYPSNFVTFLVDGGAGGLNILSDGELAGPLGSSGVIVSRSNWHQITLVVSANLSNILYLDAVPVAVGGPGTGVATLGQLFVGDYLNFAISALTMNVGYLSIYNTQLSPTRVAAHYAASLGYFGDTTDARIQRMLTFAGLTSAQWNLDVGSAVVNTYPQAGKSVLQYCQDMATTEGGGSAFYATPDGKCRFTNRYFRLPGTPTLTVDAQKDLINSSYLPSLDKVNLQNQSIVSRSGESGTLSTQTATVVNGYQVVSQPLTSYATTDADALANGQQIVAQNATPGFRFPQVGLSLFTAVNALATSVAGVQIGSRIRLGNIPAGKAPATQVDVIAEGWTETFTNAGYNWVADSSPADNPATFVFDSTTYGRFSAAGTCSLTSTITAAATSLSITTAGGFPTFTTTSGDYPLKIQIGEEVIQLNTPPGGASSPQAFTGVTRGAAGTPAAPQTGGTLLDVWPLPTFTI